MAEDLHEIEALLELRTERVWAMMPHKIRVR
jgi:hypothetical protein